MPFFYHAWFEGLHGGGKRVEDHYWCTPVSLVGSSPLAFQGALGAYVVTTLLYMARSRENSASSVSLAVIRLQKRINCGVYAWQQSFVLRVADSWKPGPLQTPLLPSNKKWNLSCFPLKKSRVSSSPPTCTPAFLFPLKFSCRELSL